MSIHIHTLLGLPDERNRGLVRVLSTELVEDQAEDEESAIDEDSPVHTRDTWVRRGREEDEDEDERQEADGGSVDGDSELAETEATLRQLVGMVDSLVQDRTDADDV